MFIKTPQEIKLMRQGGRILRQTLAQLKEATKPGVAATEINQLAGKLIKQEGGEPSFFDYQGFPANVCISLNDEVVHGPPGKKVIQEGDLVSYDLGVKYKGLYTDSAFTFVAGKQPDKKNAAVQQKIMQVCKKCLDLGIKEARVGKQVGDIGAVVQQYAEQNGFSVIRRLVGHGVGHEVHEDPRIPNVGEAGKGMKLREGMCLAIEPMICEGTYEIKLADDGWTFVTEDGKLSCHFEHTLVVGKKGGKILT